MNFWINSAEDGPSRSALDLDPEAQAVLEMMGKTNFFFLLFLIQIEFYFDEFFSFFIGKTFVSKDVRAADEQDAKNKEKEEQNTQQ